GYRLPTDAEWEFAHRAGTETRFPTGDDVSSLAPYAWIQAEVRRIDNIRPQPVGTKLPNRFGLYDMTSNVWEMCRDWYSPNYYASTPPLADPPGPDQPGEGQKKITRGGAYMSPEKSYRSAKRDPAAIDERGDAIGFRLALFVQSVQKATAA